MTNGRQDAGIIITVPTPVATITSSEAGGTAAPSSEQLIDLNRASARLPGIGEVKAQAIMASREQSGPFSRVDELLNVPGIGPVTYGRLRDLVTVGESP